MFATSETMGLAKKYKMITMFATGETMGLAEWIISPTINNRV